MMILGIQLIGITFAVFMLYMTYQNFKRKTFDKAGLFFWLIVWLGVIVIVALPSTLYGIMDSLAIQRTADLIMVGGFIFFAATTFYLYNKIKTFERKIEKLVRNMALDEAEKKEKKENKNKKENKEKKR